MLGVRADSAENNEGLGGEPGKVQVGKGADFDGGRLAVRVEGAAAVEDGLELGGGAAGDGPAEGGGEMAGDVLGRELAGVAWGVLVVLLGWGEGGGGCTGGAKDDHVISAVVFGRGHPWDGRRLR